MSAPTKPAKKRAPKAPVAVVDDGDAPQAPGPVRIGARPVEMVDIFELDGVMYQAPKRPSVALVLEYLRQLRQAHKLKGQARTVAVETAAEEYVIAILGQGAWDALGASPEVTAEDVASVVLKVTEEIAFPAVRAMTDAAGNF